jgi:RNA polymerase sigma-70 factor (ECF subfamily)
VEEDPPQEIRRLYLTIDHGDYERFIAPIRRRIVYSVWRIVRDPDETEDLVQEVLMRILDRIKEIRKHPNPTAYILRMCINHAIDHLRRTRSHRRSLEDLGREMANAPSPDSPADSYSEQELRMLVQAAIGRLPKREAEAMVLLAVEDFSYSDIAESMGCRESTVRVLITKARKRLRKWFQIEETTRKMEVFGS